MSSNRSEVVRIGSTPLQPPLLEQEFMATLDEQAGGVVCFTGRVRQDAQGQPEALFLDHYPGMTERIIQQHVLNACQRFTLLQVQIQHRIGKIAAGEAIVWVAVAAVHRRQAFEGCAFLMDFLKTEAPLWKKNMGNEAAWVESRPEDQQAKALWLL